jgi:hypothetical protein
MDSDQQQARADQQQATSSQPSVPGQRQTASGQARPGPQAHDSEGLARRFARSPVAGFVPWILYWVIGGPSTWETAAIAALLAAVLMTAMSLEAPRGSSGRVPAAGPRHHSGLDFRRVKLLDAGTVLFFAAMVIAALVTSRPDVTQLDKYAQALSSGALGLIALGSIVFGHPFTVDYARESAPPEVWHTPLFKRINVVLSATWAAIFLACAGLGLLAVHTSVKGARDWLAWYLPILLILIGIRLNSWYPARAGAAAHQADQELRAGAGQSEPDSAAPGKWARPSPLPEASGRRRGPRVDEEPAVLDGGQQDRLQRRAGQGRRTRGRMRGAGLGIGPDREHLEIVGQVPALERNGPQQALGCGELRHHRVETS